MRPWFPVWLGGIAYCACEAGRLDGPWWTWAGMIVCSALAAVSK